LTHGDDFDELYRRHAPVAFRRARLALGADADAHVIVREVFAPLHGHPSRYRGQPRLTVSLYQAVTNACLNHLADPDARARLSQVSERPSPAHAGAPRNEAALRALLFRTPPALAEIAVYYYLDELTADEITRLLELSRMQVDELLGRLSLLERTRGEGCPSDLVLDSWAAEELAPHVVAEVEKHLGHCEICQARRAGFASARAGFLLAAPTFEVQGTHVPRTAPAHAAGRRMSSAWKTGGAAAFALLAIALVALFTLRPCDAAPAAPPPAGGAPAHPVR
jgi:DNA-directed RNA polymerase specialized sigma24 family protein